jgi:HD superfamily phosphohydrolase YqeK
MCDAASTDAAAAGRLPAWSVAGPERRAHSARVAALLVEWAGSLRLDAAETARWRAAGWLHDALRDADPGALRHALPVSLRDLPHPLLHGPAAAARLRAGGCDDEELLDAIAWHTLGCERFGRLGKALYLADFLEPGRSFAVAERAALRARMPAAADAVLRDVLRSRMRHLLDGGGTIRVETLEFWNSIARKGADARAA